MQSHSSVKHCHNETATMKLLVIAFILGSSRPIENSVQDGYEAKRPQFFPIYPQKMNIHYQAGFQHT